MDLQSQIEDLKSQLRDVNLAIKSKDSLYNEKLINYEMQLEKLKEENKQSRDKYDK